MKKKSASMELVNTLSGGLTKTGTDKIVRWVGTSQQRFDELVKIFLGPDARLAQVAGWPLSYCVMQQHDLVRRHWKKITETFLRHDAHDAIKRNILRFTQVVDIPKNYQGKFMTRCFELVNAPAEKPAIKAFALTVLENLSGIYPEIKDELATVIETQWPIEKPAFRSRAKKILQKFSKAR